MDTVQSESLIEVVWRENGSRAVSDPDERYPLGQHVNDHLQGDTCSVRLQYPAPGPGRHYLTCSQCGRQIAISANGRDDDPRVVTMACKSRRGPRE